MKHRLNSAVVVAGVGMLVLIASAVLWQQMADRQAKQAISNDLLAVGALIELYKADYGRYPSSDELETTFATNPRYMTPLRGQSKNYATGLSMNSNFFYCQQEVPEKYVLVAAQNYDYAQYITNDLIIKEYGLEGVKPEDRPADYPFQVHATAQSDICPKFLPGFTDSANGYGDRDGQKIGWARWTGVE